MKYECIVDFNVDLEDDDGFSTDDFRIIKKGTVWEFYKYMDNIDCFTLFEVREDNRLFWIEVPSYILHENFEVVI